MEIGWDRGTILSMSSMLGSENMKQYSPRMAISSVRALGHHPIDQVIIHNFLPFLFELLNYLDKLQGFSEGYLKGYVKHHFSSNVADGIMFFSSCDAFHTGLPCLENENLNGRGKRG